MELNCRFLEEDEYSKIEYLFKENKDTLPNPKLSRIAAVETRDTKKIVAFFVYQLYGHTEPMWIDPEFRHNGIWIQLVEMVLPLTEGRKTFIVAATPETDEMCRRLGLKRLENPVYIRDDRNL